MCIGRKVLQGGVSSGPASLGPAWSQGQGDITDSAAIAQATSLSAGNEVALSAGNEYAAGAHSVLA